MCNLFTKKKKATKATKIYKVIYRTTYSSYDSSHTLLVYGNNPIDGLEAFYSLAGRNVKDILEFTEITGINYGGGINDKEMG